MYVVLYVFCVFFWNTLKSVNFEVVKLSRFGWKRTSKSHIHTGLIINGTVWVNLSQMNHKQSHFESLRQYYLENHICLGVQSHPEDQGDFGQGLTVNIWECKHQLELSVGTCTYYSQCETLNSIHHYEDIY